MGLEEKYNGWSIQRHKWGQKEKKKKNETAKQMKHV